MSDEFDVFANNKPAANVAKEAQAGHAAAAKAVKRPHHKNFTRSAKTNNSPIRGSNGEESVNPLLNAPLPSEQRAEQTPEANVNPNRNPELPEYRLADIQTWTAPAIVEKMMPGADPEELGSYRKHELIFAAIRTYIAHGGGSAAG